MMGIDYSCEYLETVSIGIGSYLNVQYLTLIRGYGKL